MNVINIIFNIVIPWMRKNPGFPYIIISNLNDLNIINNVKLSQNISNKIVNGTESKKRGMLVKILEIIKIFSKIWVRKIIDIVLILIKK